MKRLLLALALACAPASVAATTIVVFRLPDRIVLSSDVFAVGLDVTGTVRDTVVPCKIRRVDRFWLLNAGAWFPDVIASRIAGQPTVLKAVQALEASDLQSRVVANKAVFSQRHAPGSPLMTVIIADTAMSLGVFQVLAEDGFALHGAGRIRHLSREPLSGRLLLLTGPCGGCARAAAAVMVSGCWRCRYRPQVHRVGTRPVPAPGQGADRRARAHEPGRPLGRPRSAVSVRHGSVTPGATMLPTMPQPGIVDDRCATVHQTRICRYCGGTFELTRPLGDVLPSELPAATCAGCGRVFTPARTNQRHCRPSCRVLAFQQRRADHAPADDQADTVTRGLFE